MRAINLVDTTVRDGNQSNWGATGLDTGMMLQIAPVMERVGFEAIDFTTSRIWLSRCASRKRIPGNG